MCGIFCSFLKLNCASSQNINLNNLYESCKHLIIHRGPDFSSTKGFQSEEHEFLFAASVLWLQGNKPTEQPIDTDDSIFVYNGDVFGGSLISDETRLEEGDTLSFLKRLEAFDNLLLSLLNIQGPYAFVYLDKRTQRLYFARDIYGRRSLIIGTNSFITLLTSVFYKNNEFTCMELPALGLYCIDFKSGIVSLSPWPYTHPNFKQKLSELELFLNKTIIVNREICAVSKRQFVEPVELDLIHYKLAANTNINPFKILLQSDEWLSKVVHISKLLETAVKTRIGTQPAYCQNCISSRRGCSHTITGVLFSGGIDCAILALLAHKVTNENRPIDLLNVAFNSEAPDRVTSRETFEELKNLCPNRRWNLVEIDVTGDELQVERSNHIKNLIYPLRSVLDDSLGCALWFASRGMNRTYHSPSRVLLVGMGADELFGGYTKYRAALKRGGWSELNRLLEEDWQNISHRNLARDDRVVSDHGRQLRTPYLDENVVEYVQSLNCWERTYPSENLPQGLGEKVLLRSVGYYLGLVNAARLKKRALQFGSRIANSKENANDVSPRL